MIWVEEKNLLFIHNPKCAGSSISSALRQQFPAATTFWGRQYVSRFDNILDLAHISVALSRDFVRHSDDLFSFGVVRNPYERFRSAFSYLQGGNPGLTGVTEEEFAFDFIDEERIRFDWKFIHFCPQYRILCINNKISVSKIIRMEDFSEAWPAFSESVGLAPTLPLHNVGPKIDRSGMSDRLIARLNDLYARDFEIFSYEKVPVEVQAPRGRIQSDYISLWPEYRGCDTSDQTRI